MLNRVTIYYAFNQATLLRIQRERHREGGISELTYTNILKLQMTTFGNVSFLADWFKLMSTERGNLEK